jgi:hypothetical protein
MAGCNLKNLQDTECFAKNNSRTIRINQLPFSAAGWQHGFRICFSNFYLVKIHKVFNNSAYTEARGKISTHLECLEFYKNSDVGFKKIINDQILLNEIATDF